MLGLLFALACGSSPAVVDQEMTVACGLCQFRMPEVRGCLWAVELEGETYIASGTALPSDEEHDAHGPEGMCMRPRKAIVSGEVKGDRFWASRFDLLPAEPMEGKELVPHQH